MIKDVIPIKRKQFKNEYWSSKKYNSMKIKENQNDQMNNESYLGKDIDEGKHI